MNKYDLRIDKVYVTGEIKKQDNLMFFSGKAEISISLREDYNFDIHSTVANASLLRYPSKF